MAVASEISVSRSLQTLDAHERQGAEKAQRDWTKAAAATRPRPANRGEREALDNTSPTGSSPSKPPANGDKPSTDPHSRIFRGTGKLADLNDPIASQNKFALETPVLSSLYPLVASIASYNFELSAKKPIDIPWPQWESSDSARFDSARDTLLRNNGFQTIYAVAGQAKGSQSDEAANTSAYLATEWAKDNTLIDADPYTSTYIGLSNYSVTESDEVEYDWDLSIPGIITSRHTTKAVIDVASPKEMVDLILNAANGKPQTDLIISTHGSPAVLIFGGSDGKKEYYPLWEPAVIDELMRLKPILPEGAQIYFTGCSLAEGPEAHQIMQDLANNLNVRIYANENTALPWSPVGSSTIAFYPQHEGR